MQTAAFTNLKQKRTRSDNLVPVVAFKNKYQEWDITPSAFE